MKRLPGSQTIRDLVVASGRGSFQTPSHFFDVCVRKGPLRMNTTFRIGEERMESDVMDAEGSLHQKPHDVCVTEDVMDNEVSLH